MAAVRLGHLALRLQAPASLRASAPALQSDAATGFVPALLHALGDRLQQACGREALIRIRALRLRVSMPVAGLDAAAWIDSVSADLADQVLQTVRRERGGGQRPAPGASMQVFKDRAHETACRWCDAAERAA
ncbi:MAG TPA: hypothetical protein VLJ62_13080, partial [Burkholderiaceae bacterium]|nr:hypothetical protein [Burkholderiaceae bacterium]